MPIHASILYVLVSRSCSFNTRIDTSNVARVWPERLVFKYTLRPLVGDAMGISIEDKHTGCALYLYRHTVKVHIRNGSSNPKVFIKKRFELFNDIAFPFSPVAFEPRYSWHYLIYVPSCGSKYPIAE